MNIINFQNIEFLPVMHLDIFLTGYHKWRPKKSFRNLQNICSQLLRALTLSLSFSCYSCSACMKQLMTRVTVRNMKRKRDNGLTNTNTHAFTAGQSWCAAEPQRTWNEQEQKMRATLIQMPKTKTRPLPTDGNGDSWIINLAQLFDFFASSSSLLLLLLLLFSSCCFVG